MKVLGKKAGNLNVSQLCALLMLPRHLGGLPVFPYSTFSMRGHMDPLTQAIHSYRTTLTDIQTWEETSKLIRFRASDDLKSLSS